jgi:hypothetical protein
MAALSSLRRRTQQPQFQGAVDYSSSLSWGLVYSAYNFGAEAGLAPMNAVAGNYGTVSGTTPIGSAPLLFNGTAVSTKFNGTSDFAKHAIDLSPYRQITVSYWAYWDAFANNDHLALEYTPTWNSNSGFIIDPNESGSGQFIAGVSNGGSASLGSKSCTRPAAATWIHYSIQFDRNMAGAAAVVLIAFNAVAQSLTSSGNTFTASNFANSTLNLMSRNGTTLFAGGRLLNVNIHNRLLTLDETARLAWIEPWGLFKPARRRPLQSAHASAGTANPSRWFLAA